MRNTLPLSSFPLQGLLTIQRVYQICLILILFLLLLFKTYNLPYSAAMSAQEGIILLIFAMFMPFRIKYGMGANKTEDSTRMAVFILLTLFGFVFGIYYIFLQYYVLLIQVILAVALLIFNVLQLIFGFFSCWQFQSYQKQQ